MATPGMPPPPRPLGRREFLARAGAGGLVIGLGAAAAGELAPAASAAVANRAAPNAAAATPFGYTFPVKSTC
jgi:hypothetical protein